MGNMYNSGGEWGPVNTSWGGHSFWFAHAPWLAAILAPVVLAVVLWSLVWKGLALWHAGRRAQPWWFVIMLFINTLGILEIVYLFAILCVILLVTLKFAAISLIVILYILISIAQKLFKNELQSRDKRNAS